jgi:hypothetical protein
MASRSGSPDRERARGVRLRSTLRNTTPLRIISDRLHRFLDLGACTRGPQQGVYLPALTASLRAVRSSLHRLVREEARHALVSVFSRGEGTAATWTTMVSGISFAFLPHSCFYQSASRRGAGLCQSSGASTALLRLETIDLIRTKERPHRRRTSEAFPVCSSFLARPQSPTESVRPPTLAEHRPTPSALRA